ncbi:hypothetical protein HU200_053720 [Digitaria exilis]|uniref:RING-type E3 ubiquitin transferase n=1 Tax=Digitaria exilis TaxID=1010633 RepID=A0A835AMA5_9POAL|nr:hypothetical protein HU200_053720 [Digitaria exilis]
MPPPVQASPEANHDVTAALLPPPSRSGRRSSGGMLWRTDVLDCGVCFLPLKPPIFQCRVGHMVCSLCRDRLASMGRCHVCRAPTTFENRSHAMEVMVESFRVTCPHSALGCTYRPAYHDGERHARECPHAPLLRCPAGGCGFAATTAALVANVATVHGWPCTAEAAAGLSFAVDVHDGFNFIFTAVRGNAQYLILLDTATTMLGRAISVYLLAGDNTKCELELYYSCCKQIGLPGHYYQKARFQVACTDLSNGLPDRPNASFQFFVPKYDDGSNEVTFKVSAEIFIPTQEDKPTFG